MQELIDNLNLGEDIRSQDAGMAQYRELKDWRNHARSIERRAAFDESDEEPNKYWQQVAETSSNILKSSHDYEIAAWFAEAELRLAGYAGLAQGFALIAHIANASGEAAYPTLEEGDEITWKVQSITALNGEDSEGALIAPLYNVNVLSTEKFALWQLQQTLALEASSNAEFRERKLEEGVILQSDLQKIIANEDIAGLEQQLNAIDELISAHQQMTVALDEVFANNSPASSQISNSLQEIRGLLVQLRSLHPQANSIVVTDAPTTIAETVEELAVPTKITGDRAAALQSLQQAANYFMQYEPHSPVPYLVKRAIEWAQLSFPELISKMIDDQQQLNQVCSLAGIEPTEVNSVN